MTSTQEDLIRRNLSEDGKTLDLWGTAVTDAGLQHIPAGVQTLYLWGTAITDAGVTSLRASRPGIMAYR